MMTNIHVILDTNTFNLFVCACVCALLYASLKEKHQQRPQGLKNMYISNDKEASSPHISSVL